MLRAFQAGLHAFNRGCARFRKTARRRLAGYVQAFVALVWLALARLLPRRPRSVGPGLNPAEADPRACPEPVRSSAANGPERSEGAQGQLSEGVTPARPKRPWTLTCAGVTRAGFGLPKPVVAMKHVLRGGGGAGIQAERPSSRRLGAGPWPLIPNP